MSRSGTATGLDVDPIVERYVAVWSEPDTAARTRAVAELWTADGVEFVEGIQFRGHSALVDKVAEAHTLFVASGEYQVTYDGHVSVHDDVILFTIQLAYAAAIGASASRLPYVTNEMGVADGGAHSRRRAPGT